MPSAAKAIARRLLPHSLYRRYRRRKVASLIAEYPARQVTHDFGPHRLHVELADPLAEGWYDHDWAEPTAIGFLRGRGVVREGATVLDLGAHQAVIALMLAREVGPSGLVVAVEAEPHNARVAERNRELNGAENLVVLHAAGAAMPGVLSFAEGLNGQIDAATSSGNVEVPAVTIDELVGRFGAASLVMVDVEGYEAEVLRGGGSVLGDGSTSFLVEIHEEIADYGSSAEEVLAMFAGYECYVAVEDDDPLTPLEGPPPGTVLPRCPASGPAQLPADLVAVDLRIGQQLAPAVVQRRAAGSHSSAAPRASPPPARRSASGPSPSRSAPSSGTSPRNCDQKTSTSRWRSGSRPSTQCGQPCRTQ